MTKRLFDLIIASTVLIIFSPILLIAMLAVFLEDFQNPIYSARRVGLNNKKFNMYKIRSMCLNADKTGVESTSSNDIRITKVGKYIRDYKIDELSQFFNVLFGDMSVIGPRPNTVKEVEKYSNSEMDLLSIKPGISDFSSIVFSNEGEILQSSKEPDKDYELLIRPWKSELGIIYVRHNNIMLDFIVIIGTIFAIFHRPFALMLISYQLKKLGAREQIVEFAKRGL